MKQNKTIYLPQEQIHPVILQIDEEQQAGIKRHGPSSRRPFGGGYKYRIDNKSALPPQQENKVTQELFKSEIGIAKGPSLLKQNESQVQDMKNQRKQYSSAFLQNNFMISGEPERLQEAIHVKSSLDVVNLENVEAKLQAHRRMLKPIEGEYNLKKGKNSTFDRFNYMQTNIDVDGEYSQITKQQENKIYELAKKRQELSEEQLSLEHLWEERKKQNPKLAQYDQQYQEYLLQKDAKGILSHTVRSKLFTWDKYTQPAHKRAKVNPPQKHQSPQKQQPEQQQNVANLQNMYGHDGLESVKDVGSVVVGKDDKVIVGYVFVQLDKEKTGWISKEELHDYLLTQPHIISGYHIDVKWLYTDLDNFSTKRKGLLNPKELGMFLATLDKLHHPQLLLTQKQEMSRKLHHHQPNTSSTFPHNKHHFEELFRALDFNDDKLIRLEEYISNIYIHADCIRLLDKEAVFIKPIKKSITYRQILQYVLNDYRQEKSEKMKKSKEWISFEKFCQFFEVPEYLDLKGLDAEKGKDKHGEDTIFDMPNEYMLLLKDIFNSIPRVYQEYIVSMDFVQGCLRDPQISALSDQLCRIQSVETDLPLQSIGTTLHRMQKECDQYSTWDMLKLFFSRRGRPQDWDYQLIKKKKQLREKKVKEAKSNVKQKKYDDLELTEQFSNKKKNRAHSYNKYTLPQPFDITDMKEVKNIAKIKQGEEEFEMYKKDFVAKPVNQEILQPKPELIQGKVKSKKEEPKRPEYKYENYENDRIQRALRKAQEKYQQEQKLRQIKQKTKIKAVNIGIDLTKKYHQVIKQQKKKKREKESKNKTTQPKVSQNLYPSNMKEEKAKKMDKIRQNIQKADEVAKRKKQQQERNKKNARQKNQQASKIAEDAKKQKQVEENKRRDMEAQGYDFKPKIKKKQLSQQEKEGIIKNKQQRERKKKEEERKKLQIIQEKKRKILEHETKTNKLNVDEYSNEQILDRLDEVNFQDLLLDETSKKAYREEFNDKGKTRREIKERQLGLAGRERAAMQQEQKRMMQEKRKYKERKQQQKTEHKKQTSSIASVSGERSYKNELEFHRSKALRRYRAIMEGKQPQSEFDKANPNIEIEF